MKLLKDRPVEALRASFVRGGDAITDALEKILAGNIDYDDPLDSSPVSFLMAVFRNDLGEEQRSMLRESLLDILASFSRAGRTWSDERMSWLLYLLETTRSLELYRSRAKRLVINAINYALEHELSSHAVLVLGAAADQRLIVRLDQWEDYFVRAGRDAAVPCFLGMCSLDMRAAFLWLSDHLELVNRDHVAAGALPLILRDRREEAIRVLAAVRPKLRPPTIEFLQQSFDELTGVKHRMSSPTRSTPERVRDTLLSLPESIMGMARRGGKHWWRAPADVRDIDFRDVRELEHSGLSARELLVSIAPLNDSDAVPESVTRILDAVPR